MKFLAISRFNSAWNALAPEKQAAITLASFAYVEKYKKSGQLKEVFLLGDLKSSATVWEHKSSEEMTRAVMEIPFFAYQDVEVLAPIVEEDAYRKVFAEAMEAAQKAGSH